MNRLLIRLCALAALPFMSPTVASACSVGPDYVTPTGLDLAREADAIVLVRVEPQPPAHRDMRHMVVLTPLMAIKGTLPPGKLETAGMVGNIGKSRPKLSDPNELAYAHPDAGSGACSRYHFVPGSMMLVFLRRTDTGYRLMRSPFARDAEDVPSPDARWVKAVSLYARISALPLADQEKALREQQVRLATMRDADSRAIAADIERVLSQRARLRAPLPPEPN
ncbi:hypothetical protein [Blastomonas sp.]|uniref:hypothetical protein n=1 Tax=Blastomonas sp. TaxID=1909299 RepID=UPI00406A9819